MLETGGFLDPDECVFNAAKHKKRRKFETFSNVLLSLINLQFYLKKTVHRRPAYPRIADVQSQQKSLCSSLRIIFPPLKSR